VDVPCYHLRGIPPIHSRICITLGASRRVVASVRHRAETERHRPWIGRRLMAKQSASALHVRQQTFSHMWPSSAKHVPDTAQHTPFQLRRHAYSNDSRLGECHEYRGRTQLVGLRSSGCAIIMLIASGDVYRARVTRATLPVPGVVAHAAEQIDRVRFA
jgi:hypothetical protein